ncbi:MAG: GGDEF domain-containing protein [Ruminococcus sp.]|nr:GGDEF domain-containing protein [Ruminococcus sp.]
MVYSSIGIIGLLVQLIINYDVIFKKTSGGVRRKNVLYRRFLFGTLFYYSTDILWGIFDEQKLYKLLYADTVIYFVAMSLMVMLWTDYTTDYLEEKTGFGKALKLVGRVFFCLCPPVLIVNSFYPILFQITGQGEYKTAPIRYLLLLIQILLFTLTGGLTLTLSFKTAQVKRVRYRAISVFGFVMGTLVLVQVYNPLLPVYSVGCMLGTCLLHTFIYEDEKAEYRNKLEELLKQEKESKQALNSARTAANTDALTGVKSRRAYLEMTDRIDNAIAEGTAGEFGIIVFDINGLKNINDTLGHEEGDRYIREGCMMICRKFCHSPVYRIGGDEFVALLEGSDFNAREELLASFDEDIDLNQQQGLIEVSTGMGVFDPELDQSFSGIFERADRKMYERKDLLKSRDKSWQRQF